MLLYDPNSKTCITRITLLVREIEALELIKQLSNLIENPGFHHDHLEDYANSSILDSVIMDRIDIRTLSDDIQAKLKEMK